ncbi:ABC transporter ATP-binding protein [Pseudonocardia sp. KRD291]|uniref:ABC transporter ATP-binding protein n=1 Tax=Pseudonocardia sp. KRD291 TaxID=2792007 RepID=UPI001C4A5C7D|nr:ABC transporter ATP-binding protein [Pseudonocardia sp. KRD291]MBW0104549.1 ABC transporter ATP-binding protein [Pseudonocardia sp. KRD291]
MSAPATTSTLLGVSDLRVEFATDHGWSTVVAGTTFSVGEHEIVGLVGESGSGKTVTGLSVLGLLPRGVGRVASGSVTLGGRDLLGLSERELRSVRGNEVAMVFQEPMTSLNPAFRIGDQIAETVRLHRGGSRRAARDRAVEVLDLVGIPHARRRADDYPHEFSGGMRQRAMIAMAVSCEPSLLIADEPTTALDVTIQAQVLELLASMQAELGMSVLLVTHDLGVVAEVCERVVVMYAGQVVEQADVGELFDHPRHPYTEGLLAAMPQLGSRGHRLPSIPGRTPEPWAMPPGCRFAPRCEYALPACEEPPPLLTTRPDHLSRCLRHDELTLRGAR